MLLSERRVLLVSLCLFQVGVMSLYALLESNSVGFNVTCMNYNVHNNTSKSCVKAYINEAFSNELHDERFSLILILYLYYLFIIYIPCCINSFFNCVNCL